MTKVMVLIKNETNSRYEIDKLIQEKVKERMNLFGNHK